MFKNYFKIAWRNAAKQKDYSAINMLGLAVGLTCFLCIMLYVYDELSYDKFHADADRIYRVVYDEMGSGGIKPRIAAPGALKEAMLREIPEIENATHLIPFVWGKAVLSNEKYTYYDKTFLCVDSSFFDVFSFQLIRGEVNADFEKTSSIVLTQDFAGRFFGDEDPLGQTLQFNQEPPLKVVAIVTDTPAPSHLQFDFLISLSVLNRPVWQTGWGQGHMYTYIKVKPDASLPQIDSKIQKLAQVHLPEGMQATYFTQPLAGINGIHLSPARLWELTPNGSKLYLQVLTVVAFFILVIAGINYVNLATARSAMRAKEIGMRKVAGALRKSLIAQFLLESALIVIVAGILAVSLTETLLPFFNDLMQKELSLLTADEPAVWGGIAAIILVMSLTAGFYPAFFLSAFKPLTVLKKQRASKRTAFDLRKILVVTQFALAAFLMVGMLVVRQQVSYILAADLGFSQDQVVVIDNFGKTPNRDRNFVVRRALETIPGVLKVGAFNEMVGLQDHSSAQSMHVKGSSNKQDVLWTNVGYNYLDAVGIELIRGRHFSQEFENASSRNGIILNETAVRLLGVPEPAIGQQIIWPGWPPRTIVGVVKDFHFTSLYHEIKPFAFGWTPSGNTAALKLSGQNIRETLSEIEKTWREFVPDVPMDFYFLDDALNQQYRSEQNFQTLFSVMTFLAIIIACLGLFGLAAFTAEQCTKEIGIHKVLGATVANIVAMLSGDFVKLVVIANIVAWPIAYFAMNRWLGNFAYRIDMGPGPFALAGFLALLIAAFTVSFQAFKAATANPVQSLRYE